MKDNVSFVFIHILSKMTFQNSTYLLAPMNKTEIEQSSNFVACQRRETHSDN